MIRFNKAPVLVDWSTLNGLGLDLGHGTARNSIGPESLCVRVIASVQVEEPLITEGRPDHPRYLKWSGPTILLYQLPG